MYYYYYNMYLYIGRLTMPDSFTSKWNKIFPANDEIRCQLAMSLSFRQIHTKLIISQMPSDKKPKNFFLSNSSNWVHSQQYDWWIFYQCQMVALTHWLLLSSALAAESFYFVLFNSYFGTIFFTLFWCKDYSNFWISSEFHILLAVAGNEHAWHDDKTENFAFFIWWWKLNDFSLSLVFPTSIRLLQCEWVRKNS